MPELRKDPLVGRWVIIATERARRPGTLIAQQDNTFDSSQPCQFCENHEPEIYVVKNESHSGQEPSWKVRVVGSGTPLLKMDQQFRRRGHGLYDVVNNYGVHEVVVETPRHIANMADLSVEQIRLVLEAYVARFNALEKDRNFQYVLAYKNYGWAAGSRRIGHSRSQIIATPVNPLRVKEKLTGAKHYFDYHDRCLYCDLVRQEREMQKRVVVETEHFLAVTPFAPRFSFEIWIIPKKHHCDFAKGVIGQQEDLAGALKEILLKL